MRIVMAAMLACPVLACTPSQPEPQRLAFVDSLMSTQVSATSPGVAIVVRRGARVLHAAAYGLSAPDTGRPLTTDTPFYLASVAKVFTATTVLQLVDAKRFALDDSAGGFIDGLPTTAAAVTVRQLLTHTSGIPDYYGTLDFSKLETLDNAAVLDTIRRHGTPAFAPGSKHEYSNSNYILLAEIVRASTGKTLPLVVAERSLDRLGLTSVGYMDGSGEARPDRARAWTADSVGKFRLLDYRGLDVRGRIVPFTFRTVGAGGMVGSAADVDRWTASYFARQLLSDSLVTLATRVHVPVVPGESTIPTLEGYGFGWYVSRRHDAPIIWHDGDFAGSRTILLHAPASDLTITILANRADFAQRDMALMILDRLVDAR